MILILAKENMIQITAIVYTAIIFACVFGGGGIIRLYGDTCGLSLMDPGSWARSMLLIGSPWCRGLNWLGYVTTSVVENIWYHMIANGITWICTTLPIGNAKIPDRIADPRIADPRTGVKVD
jgi:hypothetical protein